MSATSRQRCRRHSTGTSLAKVEPAASVPAVDAPQVRTLAQHEVIVLPSAQNARVLQAWGRVGPVDVSAIAAQLREKSAAVVDGDLSTVEALLFDQALALQAIFTNLSIEASRAEHLGKLEPLLRLALKAQSQSRATLETLAMVKHGPMVIARQANIAHGHQQVNNGPPPPGHAPAPKDGSEPTEQFRGGAHGATMDTGRARSAGRADSHVEALGEVDRPTHPRGQGPKQEQSVPRCAAAKAARDAARASRGDGRAPRGARSPVKVTR